MKKRLAKKPSVQGAGVVVSLRRHWRRPPHPTFPWSSLVVFPLSFVTSTSLILFRLNYYFSFSPLSLLSSNSLIPSQHFSLFNFLSPFLLSSRTTTSSKPFHVTILRHTFRLKPLLSDSHRPVYLFYIYPSIKYICQVHIHGLP